MAGFYLRVYGWLPGFLKRRINPLEYGIRSAVQSAAQSSLGGRVLDAGAGESRFACLFNDHEYIALDSAVGDHEWDYSKIDLCADLGAIPVGSESMDLVVNTQVLEHVQDPGLVLAEFYRVLKPGGRLVLTAPQGWHEHQQPNDFFRFTRFSLEMLLKKGGFSEFKIEPIGGYFHYLGNRLTFIPKVLFQGRRGVLRSLLFPLEFVSLVLFCFLLPLVCFYLDKLDGKKEFTLCYRVKARK